MGPGVNAAVCEVFIIMTHYYDTKVASLTYLAQRLRECERQWQDGLPAFACGATASRLARCIAPGAAARCHCLKK